MGWVGDGEVCKAVYDTMVRMKTPDHAQSAALKAEWDDAESSIQQELELGAFPDERLGKELGRMLEQFIDCTAQSVPLACQDWANTKAAHRFSPTNVSQRKTFWTDIFAAPVSVSKAWKDDDDPTHATSGLPDHRSHTVGAGPARSTLPLSSTRRRYNLWDNISAQSLVSADTSPAPMPPTGNIVIWRGLTRLNNLTLGRSFVGN